MASEDTKMAVRGNKMAVRGNMHMDTRVIRVPDFKSGVI